MTLREDRTRWLAPVGVLASAFLLGVYARGGFAWPLGFVALVPWLLALRGARGSWAALASAWAMSVAFVLAVFGWFAQAAGAFTGIGTLLALLLLALLAPLLQPQLIAFALVRHWAGARHGRAIGALAGAAAWVACEWAWPKLLGDTLGHGLAEATSLRQVADLGGAAGITLALILVNEAIAIALARWRAGPRAWVPPLALALALPALMAGYGSWRLDVLRAQFAEPAPALRVGMIQSGIVDYERLRREFGAWAVVREVLDVHFSLSRAAIEQHGAQALLWSETVYPTPYGHPRSEDGAALDAEIQAFVDTAAVPLVFGSYDVDAAGEYNAAVFLEPRSGVLGYYRKTHPFPFTEQVPGWLDGPLLRSWLPWTGSWQAGNGARVFPLRVPNGGELQVLPLVCLDDVRPQLAIDGARLGAQAIVGLSNDSWFSAGGQGARLHLAVAVFRSIETRLPQLRVTGNGLTAFVDPSGEVLAQTTMGDRAVLAGEVPVRTPPGTLMVAWGDWVGRAALGLLLLLAAWRLFAALAAMRTAPDGAAHSRSARLPATAVLLGPGLRVATGALRALAGVGLLVLLLAMLFGDGLQLNSLAQIRLYLALVVAPLLLVHTILSTHAARWKIAAGQLLIEQRHQRIEIPLASIAGVHAWRLSLPESGVDLKLGSGRRIGLALADPLALIDALNAAGAALAPGDARDRQLATRASRRAGARHRLLDQALVKFGLFPLLLALPAFRLHQVIAFGGGFGEWSTYGARAWLLGLGIWWAAWAIGLMLYAATLRVLAEIASLVLPGWRHATECLLRGLYYLAAPAWLAWRVLVG